MFCKRCGAPPKYPVPDDVVEYTCSRCATSLVAVQARKQEQKLMQVSPQDVKKVRKSLGMYQKDLDFYLKLPTNHTNQVENGHKLPNETLYKFIKGVLDGTNTKIPNKSRGKKTKKRRKGSRKL